MMDGKRNEIMMALLLRMVGATWTEVCRSMPGVWEDPAQAIEECMEFLIRETEGVNG